MASLDDTGETVARAVTDCYTARRAYAEYLIRTLHHIILYINIICTYSAGSIYQRQLTEAARRVAALRAAVAAIERVAVENMVEGIV